MPPHVSVPRPGPCPGNKAAKAVKKAVAPPGQKIGRKKAVAKPAAEKPQPAPAAPKPGRKLTRKTATAMQEQMLDGKPWTDGQKDAIAEYTGDEYLNINARLRGVPAKAYGQTLTDPDPAKTAQRIKDINEALRPLPEPVRVYRMAYSAEGLGLPVSYTSGERLRQLRTLIGQRRQERGFFSSSIKPLTGKEPGVNGDVRIEVTLPAGTRAAYVRSVSENKNEDEIVGEPGIDVEFYELDETGIPPLLKARVVPDGRS